MYNDDAKKKKKDFLFKMVLAFFYSVIKIEGIFRSKIAHRHASSVRFRNNYRFVSDIPYVLRRTCLYRTSKKKKERVAFHLQRFNRIYRENLHFGTDAKIIICRQNFLGNIYTQKFRLISSFV